MTDTRKEAGEKITLQAYDIVSKIAIGGEKDYEDAYRELAVQREMRLMEIAKIAEEREGESFISGDGSIRKWREIKRIAKGE